MKINELLSEAINLTKYLDDIEVIIDNSIKKAISSLSPAIFQKFKNSVNRSKNYNSMVPALEDELRTSITSILEQNLQSAGMDILSSVDSEYAGALTVEFKDLPDDTHGQATDFGIDINTMFIDRIIEEIVPNLVESVTSSIYDDENMFDDFFQISKQKPLQQTLLNGSFMERNIDDIASNFIHELVHVRQHIPQFKKGRDETEYRSYLDKTKGEFGKVIANPQDSTELKQRYWDLYVASPQEIAARAHQAAIRVIKDTGLNAVRDIEEIPKKNQILADVNQYAREQFKTPENPKETQVFNRYIKLIYQEVDRYYDMVKNKLS